MNTELKDKLVALGADTLAEALITLSESLAEQATQDHALQTLIFKLCEHESEQAETLIQTLQQLAHTPSWRQAEQAPQLAQQLTQVLQQIQHQIDDPYLALDLVCRFYQTDHAQLSQTQDPQQHLRQVYEYDAHALFINYAKRCDDQAWLADKLLTLMQQDPWQVRQRVWADMTEFLHLEARHQLIERVQTLIQQAQKPSLRRYWQARLCTLARLNQDGALYEQTRLAASEFIDNALCVDIARVYLESDDKANALLWLNRIPTEL
ncbi:MAG: DUF6880 family protein [Thiomicrospira sp.]